MGDELKYIFHEHSKPVERTHFVLPVEIQVPATRLLHKNTHCVFPFGYHGQKAFKWA